MKEEAIPDLVTLDVAVAILLMQLVESFLYGAYVGLVFVPIYNFLFRRWGLPTRR